jgi:hypothetical protein
MTAVNKVAILTMFGILIPGFAISQVIQNGFAILPPILIFWAPFSFFIIRWVLRLTQVELAGEGIFVSRMNFGTRKEIFVPFKKIRGASQHFFQRGSGETVTIEFREDTEFGRKIKFMPKTRFLALPEHPIVDEINSHLD